MCIRIKWPRNRRWGAISWRWVWRSCGAATARALSIRRPSSRTRRCLTASVCRRATMCSCRATASWCRCSQAGFRSMTATRKRTCPAFSLPSLPTIKRRRSAFIIPPPMPRTWRCRWWRTDTPLAALEIEEFRRAGLKWFDAQLAAQLGYGFIEQLMPGHGHERWRDTPMAPAFGDQGDEAIGIDQPVQAQTGRTHGQEARGIILAKLSQLKRGDGNFALRGEAVV